MELPFAENFCGRVNGGLRHDSDWIARHHLLQGKGMIQSGIDRAVVCTKGIAKADAQ